MGDLSELGSLTLSVMVFTENGAEQSQIGIFAAIPVKKFKAWPQYLLPDVSPQVPPEPMEYNKK